MTNLLLESYEIDGARKLLLKLQGDFAFAITPVTRHDVKPEYLQKHIDEGKPLYEWYRISPSLRKLAGEAMVRWLLESKDNMRKYLYGEPILYAKYTRDKKDKVIRIDIYEK